MRQSENRIGYISFALIFIIFTASCIVEEYKINKLTIDDEEWQTKLTAPLFKGDLEVRDLIDYGRMNENPAGNESVILEFSPDSFLTVPAQLLFEPFTFIERFHFLIADDYELTEGRFKYIVTNGSPFPLNLKTDFYQNSRGGDELSFLPPPFPQGEVTGDTVLPVTTVYEMDLTPAMLRFVQYNSVAFTSWFERAVTNETDTIAARAPVEIQIILSATAKEIRDE